MTPTGGAAVELRGVHKSFGDCAVLRGVDLDVAGGSITAVLGASGSGKTTLLRILAGFELLDQGTVRIDGDVVCSETGHVRAERRGIGYVAQEGNLFPHLDVARNVGFGLRRSKRGRVQDLLEMVGLTGLACRYPHQLSGGQQQRVALARALATEPRLVLLDEPFASLDVSLRADVRAEVLSVLRTAGTTAVLVTHDQDEALSVADVVAVLRDGVVAQSAAPKELYDHPVDAGVAAFVGEANLLDGTVVGARVRTAAGEAALRVPGLVGDGGRVVVLVRPEQLSVGRALGGGLAAVEAAEFHGHDTTVRLRALDASLPPTMLARVPGSFDIAVGTAVDLVVVGGVEAWPAA